MNRTSRCEGTTLDTSWYSTLRLLGLRDTARVTLTEGMFDHPNPAGFQLVFHFLAVMVAGREAVAAQFRDCWPVTDRKQEAEYRRRLTGLLRDWGRQWPRLLPPHPPASLLQSPGGRKFISLLSCLARLALWRVMERGGVSLLSLPAPPPGMRARLYRLLQQRTSQALEAAVVQQAGARQAEAGARAALATLATQFACLRERQQEETETREAPHGWEERCGAAREVRIHLDREFQQASHLVGAVTAALQGEASRPRLQADEVPKSLRCGEGEAQLSLSYAALSSAAARTLAAGPGVTGPGRGRHTAGPGLQLDSLHGVQAELVLLLDGLKESVDGLLARSATTNWGVAGRVRAGSLLPPPSPSLATLTARPGLRSVKFPDLGFRSPAPRAQLSRPPASPLTAPTSVIPTASVIPLDSTSYFACSATSELAESQAASSKLASIPSSLVQSSAASITVSPSSASPTTPPAQLDSTRRKIDLYRRVLAKETNQEARVEIEDKVEEDDNGGSALLASCEEEGSGGSSLLASWSNRRFSLSPGPPDTAITSRLDLLMTSLALDDKDESLDASLGLQLDLHILSPH